MVQTWTQRSRVKWDAIEGSSGGTERTAWEALLDMKKCRYKAEGDGQGSSHACGGLGYIIENVQFSVVWSWAFSLWLSTKHSWSTLWLLSAYSGGYFPGGRVADLLKTITAISQDLGDRSSCCGLSCRTPWEKYRLPAAGFDGQGGRHESSCVVKEQ